MGCEPDTALPPAVLGVSTAGLPFLQGTSLTDVKVVAIPSEGALPEGTADITFLVASRVELPRDRISSIVSVAKDLKVVQTLSAGVDAFVQHMPPGVILCSASGAHDIPVAEWCMAAILAMMRQLPNLWMAQRQECWESATHDTIHQRVPAVGILDDLEDKKVLIVGYGSIGKALSSRLQPFKAEVIGVARTAKPGVHAMSELGALLPTAHVVVILLPLTDTTRGLIDATFLAQMKPGALLVNAGRGPIVVTDALVAALQSGRIRAALDVTDPEPLPRGHPLWKVPGVMITPHIGGAVQRMRVRGYAIALDNLARFRAGQPLRNVQAVTPA